jgi:hypothetical protein
MRNAENMPRAGESSKRKRSAAAPVSARPASLGSAPKLFRACACGGGCPRCAGEASVRVQPKLDPSVAVSQPHEPLEREADRMAENAMRSEPSATTRGVPHASVAAFSASGDTLAPAGGHPLERGARADMEARFGADFGAVRIHTGEEAARSAARYDALAYTAGRNVVFGENQYAPASADGRKLLAHELAHVVQQTHAPAQGATAGARVLRAPVTIGGKPPSMFPSTSDMHADQMEQYRAANGLPPHGIDPATGEPVGPTDAELRAGILDAWLREKSGAIDAPAQAPKLAGAGHDDVETDCRKQTKGDEERFHYCRRHREFVRNVLPRVIENIRAVPSPYSEAIAKLYASALPTARLLLNATPGPKDTPLVAIGYPGPLKFGSTTHNFGEFRLVLHQKFSEPTAEEIDLDGAIAIVINEITPEVLLKDLPSVESAMVHEAMHAFAKAVEEENLLRAASGVVLHSPASTAPVDQNLDRSSYGVLQARLEAAVLPFVRQIQALPSQGGPALRAEFWAQVVVHKMFDETFSRVEELIYAKQRAGQGFGTGDLTALPHFYTFAGYWEPQPAVQSELFQYLEKNSEQIENALAPLINEVGARYLSLRPRTASTSHAATRP